MFTKLNSLLGVSALALVLFSACQREPKAEDNPTYNKNENTVTAKFVLNISANNGKDTKTTEHYAQLDNNFLGMEAVHILTYKIPYGGAEKFFYNPLYNGNPVGSTRDYDFGSLFSAGDVDANHSSRTLELALPLETNAVAIYGKAYKDKNSSADDLQGKVTTTGKISDLRSICFGLTPRATDESGYEGATFLFSKMLTGLIVAGLVNEKNFHLAKITNSNNEEVEIPAPTGQTDRSFHFWWPEGFDGSGYTIDNDGYYLEGNGSKVADGKTVTIGTTQYTYHTGQVSWKQMGIAYEYAHDNTDATNPDVALYNLNKEGATVSQSLTMDALIESLGAAYSRLVDIKKKGSLKELRAGSASAVLRTMKDLSAIVEKVANATPTSWHEKVAVLMAQELRRRIALFFYGNGENLSYKELFSTEGIVENLKSFVSSTDWDTYGEKVKALNANVLPISTNEGGFPKNIGLPYGAACLDSDRYSNLRYPDQFKYVREVPAYGMGSATFDVFNYVYPAELMYYGNSSIGVSDESIGNTLSIPSTLKDWLDLSKGVSGWTFPGSVKSTTRTVAVRYPINYGSALLESTVMYAEGVTILKDNRAALFSNEKDNEIIVSGEGATGGFSVTGFIIGGQPGAVGWDYTIMADPESYSSSYKYNATEKKFDGITYGTYKFNKMIYDKVSPGFRIGSSSTSNKIYTICFDNYDPTLAADKQSDVYIALELVNNTGHDFWGELNMVRAGGTFYLVGKLDLTKLRNTGLPEAFNDLSRSDYHYPPFDPSTGETINAPRVFMQDFKTTANLILDADCLKHAYVTVPDLRASQVSLGLSIDVSWQPGLAFNVKMGTLE